MANYQLELWQNNEILHKNRNWHVISSGFVIEVHVRRRSNGVIRSTTNWTSYQENGVFLSREGMREFLTRILLAEQIPINLTTGGFLGDNGVQLICRGPSGLPLLNPVYILEYLVFSVLEIVFSIRNNSRNRNLTLVPIQLDLAIIQIRQPSSSLDDLIVLNDELLEEVRVDQVIKLKEERVEVSTDCCICVESVDVGETVARLPCSHLFHTTCITSWLHNKPSCPLCRAPASLFFN